MQTAFVETYPFTYERKGGDLLIYSYNGPFPIGRITNHDATLWYGEENHDLPINTRQIQSLDDYTLVSWLASNYLQIARHRRRQIKPVA